MTITPDAMHWPATSRTRPAALSITDSLTGFTDLGDNPRTGISSLLGGASPVLADTQIGTLQFWVTGDCAAPARRNAKASALANTLVRHAVDGSFAVPDDARARLRLLRAHGWIPEINGPVVITGPNTADGQPGPLPEQFLDWLDDHIRDLSARLVELLGAALTARGVHLVVLCGHDHPHHH